MTCGGARQARESHFEWDKWAVVRRRQKRQSELIAANHSLELIDTDTGVELAGSVIKIVACFGQAR